MKYRFETVVIDVGLGLNSYFDRMTNDGWEMHFVHLIEGAGDISYHKLAIIWKHEK